MLVIGGRELRFRVNVKPTGSVIAPKNYGPFHDLSAIPAAPRGRDTGRQPVLEFDEIPAIEDRACGRLTGYSALAVPPPL